MSFLASWWAQAQSSIVWDALIIAVVFGGSLAYALTLGRKSLVTTYVSVGLAGLVTLLAPSLQAVPYLNTFSEAQQDFALFLMVLVLAFVIFKRNSFFTPYIVPTGLEKIVFSILLAGFVTAVAGAFLPPEMVATIHPNVQAIFLAPTARLAWVLAPLLGAMVLRGENAW